MELERRVVRVHNRTVYHVSRIRVADGDRTEQVVYADGRRRYVPCGTAAQCSTGSIEDTETYELGTVLGLLSGTESSVEGTVRRDGGVRYRIVASGNPASIGSPYGVVDVRNYTATALVAPSGLVSDARASYVVVRGETRIRVTIRLRYTDIGETRVTPPPWYGRNATAD